MIYEFERKYEDFDQFCMHIKNPDDLMSWFKHNKVIWNRTGDESIDPNEYPFAFPDDIIENKEGICYDIGLFVYYFCKRFRIPVRVGRIALYIQLQGSDEYYCWGHIFAAYKYNKNFHVFHYDEDDAIIYGKYSSWDEALEKYAHILFEKCSRIAKNKYDVTDIKGPFFGYIKPEGYEYIDAIYNNHNITQNQFIEMFPDAYVRFPLDD